MSLLGDLRLTVRALRASPGFAATAVLTLGVAMGAALSVAAVADRVLLRPLPFAGADRLATVLESDGGEGLRLASYPTFEDWAAQSRAFAGLAFVRGNTVLLRGAEGAERLTVGYVTPGFLDVLGARPALGRAFAPDEERSDAGSPVVLSHETWRQRFGGDPGVVGRTLRAHDGTLTVIGVMPPGTTFPAWAEAWRPIAAAVGRDPALAQRGVHSDSRVLARLRPDVPATAAAAELRTIAGRVAAAHPADARGWSDVVTSAMFGRERVVDVVPAGRPIPRAREPVPDDAFRLDLLRLARRYDLTVVTAPVVHAARGAHSILPAPDVILCVRAAATRLHDLRTAVDALQRAGLRLQGILLWDDDLPAIEPYSPAEWRARARVRTEETADV